MIIKENNENSISNYLIAHSFTPPLDGFRLWFRSMILWPNAPLPYRLIAKIFSQIRGLPSQPGNRILDHEYFVVLPRSLFSLSKRKSPVSGTSEVRLWWFRSSTYIRLWLVFSRAGQIKPYTRMESKNSLKWEGHCKLRGEEYRKQKKNRCKLKSS